MINSYRVSGGRGARSPPLRWGPEDGARPVARANKPDRAEGGIDPGSVFAASPPSVTYGDIHRKGGDFGAMLP